MTDPSSFLNWNIMLSCKSVAMKMYVKPFVWSSSSTVILSQGALGDIGRGTEN
jgi:hypothetical protein